MVPASEIPNSNYIDPTPPPPVLISPHKHHSSPASFPRRFKFQWGRLAFSLSHVQNDWHLSGGAP